MYTIVAVYLLVINYYIGLHLFYNTVQSMVTMNRTWKPSKPIETID